jgi:hypothetical protein
MDWRCGSSECLLCKHEAVSSNPILPKKKKYAYIIVQLPLLLVFRTFSSSQIETLYTLISNFPFSPPVPVESFYFLLRIWLLWMPHKVESYHVGYFGLVYVTEHSVFKVLIVAFIRILFLFKGK